MRRPLCVVVLIFVTVIQCLLLYQTSAAGAWEGLGGQTVAVNGTVCQKEDTSFILKDISRISLSGEAIFIPKETKILCKTQESLPGIGQQALVRGRVHLFTHAANPGGFDAADYYESRGIAFCLDEAMLKRVSGKPDIRERLYRLRKCMGDILERYLSRQDASVMGAMLLGEKKGMDPQIKSLYQKGGIAHVLAISGMHISFFGMALYRLVKRLGAGSRTAALVSGVFLGIYVIMVGGTPSALRALFMFWLFLAAGLWGRTYDSLTALAVAAALLVAGNPYTLRDAGFQLSFAAVLGISLLVPKVQLTKKTVFGRLTDSFLSGAAISAVTLPVVFWYFYEYPLYALLLNLIVIPGMGFLLPLGSCLLLTGNLLPPVARALSLPVHGILWCYEKLCLLGQRLPFLKLTCGRPELWKVAVYYGALCLLVYACEKEIVKKRGLWCCLAALVTFLCIRAPAGLRLTMLDVGQGDCFVLQKEEITASGISRFCFLIDGGSSSKQDTGIYDILPFLKYQGIRRVDAILISHLDADHYNGVLELLDAAAKGDICIRRLYLPVLRASAEDNGKKLEELLTAAKKAGAACYELRAGETIQAGELRITCLYPFSDSRFLDNNGASQVLRVSQGNFTALFTGDLGREGEEALVAGGGLERCQVLKVAHHGSAGSSCREFLDALRPRLALISCGRNNSYGHPARETLERLTDAGARTLISYETGAVTLTVKEREIRIFTY